jgi:glycine/D-amino acid oxidase-like deaminating enzyme
MTKSESYWWEDAGAPKAPAQVPLPREVDVVIVGAGFTGLSAARTIARAGKSVLALDAGAPGIGASSRNGGMFGGGHRLSIAELTSRFGAATAKGILHEAQIDATAFARSLMVEEKIDCDYRESGRFRGLWRLTEYEAAAIALKQLKALVPIEAEMIPKALQHREVATDLYVGGVAYARHGSLHPAKWVAGLLQAALRAGAMVQGDTPVIGIQPDGNAHLVKTPRGVVRCAEVLAATNGYTPSSLPHLRRRIIPVTSFMVATEILGRDRVKRLFPSGKMIVESRDRHCYYRPSPDGMRVLFGGRAAMFEAPEWLARSQMRSLLGGVFPELRSVRLTHSWRGRTGFTFDLLPNVGKLNGIWHAMGYSGNGNAMAVYLGHKVGLQILGDSAGSTAFSSTGFPIRWWHQGRPWFLPFADLTFRLKDVYNNLASKV